METEVIIRGHTTDGRELYEVRADAGQAFDRAVLEFIRWWWRQDGHALSRLVVERGDLTPGRGMALVIEGIPLITRLTSDQQPGWDFRSWSKGLPQPIEGNGPVSLEGRVRWYRVTERQPDGTKVFVVGAQFPDHDWWVMVRRFLDANPRHIALFESTFNTEGASTPRAEHTEIVVHRGQVMHLLTPQSTNGDIEEAWDSAAGWGGGEKVGFLTELPPNQNLAPGDELSDITLHELARRTQVIGMQAFDAEGMLVWGIGPESRRWIDGD